MLIYSNLEDSGIAVAGGTIWLVVDSLLLYSIKS